MTAPVNDNVLFNITMLLRGGRGRREGDKASGEERQKMVEGKLKGEKQRDRTARVETWKKLRRWQR